MIHQAGSSRAADCGNELRLNRCGSHCSDGTDPMADRGAPPFETCDSTLRLAEHLGVGTRDLARIEVVGTPIEKARFRFPTLTQLTT